MHFNKRAGAFLALTLGAFALWIAADRAGSSKGAPAADRPASNRRVELKASGFTPSSIIVQKGDTVIFTTTLKKPFWPASDPHPIHSIFPSFDPKRPIDGKETWSFTFSEVGTWRYHDHLSPESIGAITVTTDERSKTSAYDCGKSEKLDEVGKRYCWRERLIQGKETGGTRGAFEVLKSLYASDPLFVTSGGGCHAQAHTIGDWAYEDFKRVKDIRKMDLPPETVDCGYGYFHGLLEHMFRDNPDPSTGREICEYLTERFSATIPRIRLNCFHGIGHGFVPQPLPGDRLWGNAQAIVAPALETCDTISPTRDEIETMECLMGGFNVISDWTFRKEYGLAPDENNPLGFCALQTSRLRKLACYYEMGMHLNPYTKDDIAELATRFIDQIPEDEYANQVITVTVAGSIQRALSQPDYDAKIRTKVRECHEVASRLRISCIKGIVGGLAAHGQPGKEYVKILEFCARADLRDDERDACYELAAQKLVNQYPRDKAMDVCKAVPTPYKEKYCPR